MTKTLLQYLELICHLFGAIMKLTGVSTTTFGGSFSKNYLVPNAQLLGKITVEVNFDNTTQPFYDNASKTVEFTVVSETLIFIPDTELVRGSDIWFNGSILDDRGQPVEDIEVNIFGMEII